MYPIARVARSTALSSIVLLWRRQNCNKHGIESTFQKRKQKHSKGVVSSRALFAAFSTKLYCFGSFNIWPPYLCLVYSVTRKPRRAKAPKCAKP